jgi:hypothetical protein
VHDVVLGEQFQGLGDIEDDLPNLVLVGLESGVEVAIVNAVHLLVIILLAFELVEGVAQRISAFLIEDPGVLLVDEVVVEFDQVLNARAGGEFLLGRAAELEEVGAEPDLLYVGLVAALGDYLLYRVLLVALLVLPQPHQRKTATPEQLYLLETVGEAVAEGVGLLPAEIEGVLLLFLPPDLYLLQGFLPLLLAGAIAFGQRLLGSAFVLLLLAGEQLHRLDAGLVHGLLLQRVLDVALLTRQLPLLLPQLQVLQTLRNVLLKRSLLEA